MTLLVCRGQALQRHQASRRDPDAAIVRVCTRHTFTLLDEARTKFVPLDLLPRLLCRAHAVAGVRRVGGEGGAELLWRDGCVYELSSGCVGKLSLEGNHLLVRAVRHDAAVLALCEGSVAHTMVMRRRLTCAASTRTTCGGV